jgi:hypothetical protein
MEETIARTEKPKRQNPWVARALGIVPMLCVFIPAFFWKGGVLEGETVSFMINYSDDRSVLQKVFNPLLNDFNMYQARELSYFFDYLDTTFFLFLLKRFDVTLFIPLSAVVATILIILVYRRGVRRTLPGLDRVTAELLLLPFLTCFVVISTMGLFYRSAKPLLAPVLLALMFHILRSAQSRARGQFVEKRWTLVTRQSLVTFGLLVIAALLDRQGFFYILVTCSLLLVHFLITRKLKDLLIASVAAAIVAHLYNVVIGPAIIWAINGQRPDFTFQRIPMGDLAGLPVHCLKAARVLTANLAAMAGGFYVVGYLIVALVAAWLVWGAIVFYKESERGKRWEHYTSGQSLAIVYAVMVLAAHIVMFGLMIARHHYIYEWADHWYWYYPLPFIVTTLFGLAVLLNAVLPGLRTVNRRILKVALVLIALSNLAHLPRYRTLMVSGSWFGPVYRWSENLKASIRHRDPHPELGPEFKRFLIFHEKRRQPAK